MSSPFLQPSDDDFAPGKFDFPKSSSNEPTRLSAGGTTANGTSKRTQRSIKLVEDDDSDSEDYQTFSSETSAFPADLWSSLQVSPNYTKEKKLIEKILDFREANSLNEKEINHTNVPTDHALRHDFLVKYRGVSYGQCEWISFKELSSHPRCAVMLKSIMRISENFVTHPTYDHLAVIDRIIVSFIANGHEWFLVKWNELSMTECTWEYSVPSEILHLYNHRQELRERKTALLRTHKTPNYNLRLLTADEVGVPLRSHQLDGLHWLRFNISTGKNGLLADQSDSDRMIQTLALAETMKMDSHPILIIVPLSMIGAWISAIRDRFPDLVASYYIGSAIERQMIVEYEWKLRSKSSSVLIGGMHSFDVLITTYEIFLRDLKILSQVTWSSIFIEQAHRLKKQRCFTMDRHPFHHLPQVIQFKCSENWHSNFPTYWHAIAKFGGGASVHDEVDRSICIRRRFRKGVLEHRFSCCNHEIASQDIAIHPPKNRYYNKSLERNFH
jgi:hypothetical protein